MAGRWKETKPGRGQQHLRNLTIRRVLDIARDLQQRAMEAVRQMQRPTHRQGRSLGM
jgi:hypothetical protein